MADTRSARKTSTPRPAKKTTAAKKTAARTPRKTTAKKTTTARLSLVKPRPDLPTRNKPYMTDVQGYATLAARIAGIYTPRITAWTDHGDGTATRPLKDGTLHYTQDTRALTWQATCRMGAIHTYVLDSPSTAAAARVQAATCQQVHADLTKVRPLTADELAELGLLNTPTWARPDLLGDDITATIPIPLPDQRDRALGDELTHSASGIADTQPLSTEDISAHIAEQLAADTETTRKHPDHA